jgi:hypothetical protein
VINENVLNSLPEAQVNENTASYLTDADGKILYSFLYNPERRVINKQAVFSEVSVGGTNRQPQFYGYTKGSVLELNDLLFDTHCSRKNSKKLIEGLGTLMTPDATTLKPPVLYYVQGSYVFGGCYLIDLTVSTDLFLSGEHAGGRIDIKLQEIPSEALSNIPQNQSSRSAVNPSTNLTARQIADGVSVADNYVNTNILRFSPTLQNYIRGRSYEIAVATNGEVNINFNNLQEYVGNYNGLNLTGVFT